MLCIRAEPRRPSAENPVAQPRRGSGDSGACDRHISAIQQSISANYGCCPGFVTAGITEAHDEECMDCGEDDAYEDGLQTNDVFIVEGQQERYGSKKAWELV